MASLGTPVSLTPPFQSTTPLPDCSQRICTGNCPQWCSIVFPPPPPSFGLDDDDSGANLSPLIIVLIAILAAAFLLVAYYTIFSKYRRRRGGRNPSPEPGLESSLNQLNHGGGHWQAPSAAAGLDEAMIKSIGVCKYVKGDGLIDGTECVVCLADFRDGESLRLLPECTHAFHLLCIDPWLKSHSDCPICRAAVVAGPPPQPPPSSQGSNSALHISALEIRHRNDLVLVVNDLEGVRREEVVPGVVTEPPLRRSVSTVSVADILLQIEEDYEDSEPEIQIAPAGKSTKMEGSIC